MRKDWIDAGKKLSRDSNLPPTMHSASPLSRPSNKASFSICQMLALEMSKKEKVNKLKSRCVIE